MAVRRRVKQDVITRATGTRALTAVRRRVKQDLTTRATGTRGLTAVRQRVKHDVTTRATGMRALTAVRRGSNSNRRTMYDPCYKLKAPPPFILSHQSLFCHSPITLPHPLTELTKINTTT